MKDVLDRYVTRNLKSLQDAAKSGDVEVTKQVLSVIPPYFEGHNDEIKKSLAKAYSTALDAGNDEIAELIFAAIAEPKEDSINMKEEDSTKKEEDPKGLLRAFGSMAGTAKKYVVEEEKRDETAEELKEKAKTVGDSLINLGKQTKNLFGAVASKEDISEAGEKITKKFKEIRSEIREMLKEENEEDDDEE